MVVALEGSRASDRLRYYIESQASGVREYLWQVFWTTALGGIPGILGIGLRAAAYPLIMRMDGVAAIEANVRLRNCRNIHLGRGVFWDHKPHILPSP